MKNEDENLVSKINVKLQMQFAIKYEDTFRIDEAYMLEDKKLRASLDKVRELIGLTEFSTVDDDNVAKWAVSHIQNYKSISKKEASLEFSNLIYELLLENNLNPEWEYYITVWIIKGAPPSTYAFRQFARLKVLEIKEDNAVTVELKPGLSYDDYVAAWKELSKTLGKPLRLKKASVNAVRDFEIYDMHRMGMSYSQLARRYFRKLDKYDGVEMVKTILKRVNKRFKGGTKLTK